MGMIDDVSVIVDSIRFCISNRAKIEDVNVLFCEKIVNFFLGSPEGKAGI